MQPVTPADEALPAPVVRPVIAAPPLRSATVRASRRAAEAVAAASAASAASGADANDATATVAPVLPQFDRHRHCGRPPRFDPDAAALPPAPVLRQYLSCRMGGDTYAMRIEQLREIVEFRGVTEVPMTPAFCRGVINLRGTVIPVIDLAQRLGRGATPAVRRSCILIVELPTENGMVVAGVMASGSRTVIAAQPTAAERAQFETLRDEIARFEARQHESQQQESPLHEAQRYGGAAHRGGVLPAEFIEDMIMVGGVPQMALDLQRILAPAALSLLIGAAPHPGAEPRAG